MKRIIKTIKNNKWIFAKTMPSNPHSYIRRSKDNNDDFIYFVGFIRRFGKVYNYGGRNYVGLNINGHLYWTMGEPIDLNGKWHTIILNRAKTVYASQYDNITVEYKKAWEAKQQILLRKKYNIK